jgi:hypothetical protein
VMLSGHTSLTAVIVYCALIGLARTHPRTPRSPKGSSRSRSSPA